MAKFKIGDKVRSKDYPDAGMMTITQIGQDVHGTTYRTKWENGSVPSQVFYDSTLVAANSVPVSTNPVVQNALNSTYSRIGKIHKDSPIRGFYQFISDDGIIALDASNDPREAKRIAEKAGFKVQNALNRMASNTSTNASRGDAVLADYKKFVKAQMAAVLLALENAKRDISAQGETSAKTAKATSSTDEHEIIRDYSGKTAKAIDEAISKLKSAKENPLIL